MSAHAPSENSNSSTPKWTFIKSCFSSIIAIWGQINCITNATSWLDLLPGKGGEATTHDDSHHH